MRPSGEIPMSPAFHAAEAMGARMASLLTLGKRQKDILNALRGLELAARDAAWDKVAEIAYPACPGSSLYECKRAVARALRGLKRRGMIELRHGDSEARVALTAWGRYACRHLPQVEEAKRARERERWKVVRKEAGSEQETRQTARGAGE